jgi:isopentenyl-diphosphate Delta-isomerase
MEQRKSDHIRIALQSRVGIEEHDVRFHYEPFLSAHPLDDLPKFRFLGKILHAPLWVSSMTGGAEGAFEINRNLARACREFGMGMSLGSCRILLHQDTYLRDFDVRDIIGDELPLYANLGIAQVEQLIDSGKVALAHKMVEKLRADGLIIHVNPLQEWFQPEGDPLKNRPLDTIHRFLDETQYPVIVKEVGQGIGPASLKELFKLPLAAIEFASFGGTNFAKAELLRGNPDNQYLYEPYTRVGETAVDMIGYVNSILGSQYLPGCHEIIVSGGIRNFLDGYYVISKINTTAIYGQASAFLMQAKESYEALAKYCTDQINGLKLAYAYLTVK